MQKVKWMLRCCGATAITLLFGLLPMGFRTIGAVPPVQKSVVHLNLSVDNQRGSRSVPHFSETCPTANFSFSGSKSGLPTIFTNLSTQASACSWDFGDGSSSTETNPQHTYAQPGSYQVRLTVYGGGCEDSFIGTLDVIGG